MPQSATNPQPEECEKTAGAVGRDWNRHAAGMVMRRVLLLFLFSRDRQLAPNTQQTLTDVWRVAE